MSNVDYKKTPIVIGGTGGSGTRIVTHLLMSAGIFMGTNLGHALDAQELTGFYKRWINLYWNKDIILTRKQNKKMIKDFTSCVKKHRYNIPDTSMKWGWKNPRSIFLLPFIHTLYPEFKFIHIIRDGRDMAYSENQNQLYKHGEIVLDENIKNLSTPLRSAALWNLVNLSAAEYSENYFKNNYLRIRFENLCKDSENTIKELYEFVGIYNFDLDNVVNLITPPESLGRWKQCDQKELSALVEACRPGLQYFGYLSEEIL